ncbi:hypothetical protein V2J09_023216 [Rumex salicifolius]
MATMGVRRLKERGGAGGKVTAGMPNSKPLTPLSDKSKALLTTTSINRSTVKEKPRSVSRGPAMSQKPEMRPMPRIDKSSAAGSNGVDGEIRRRLSSSSVPRGRSSSPSDFSRVISDMRRTRVSRVPGEQVGRAPITKTVRSHLEVSAVRAGSGKVLSGFSGSERKGARESSLKSGEKRVYGGLKENMNIGVKLVKECGKVLKDISAVDAGNDLKSSFDECAPHESEGLYDCQTDISLSAMRFPDEQHKIEDPNVCLSIGPQEPSVRESNVAVKFSRNHPDLQKARPDLRSKVYGNSLKGVSVFKEKEVNGVSNSGRVGDRNHSKLHEKLAFLEGKVKRIASDIKRTKEMLDKNNPDASKVIISDIQEKISGIEKAMNHVVGESGQKSSFSESMDEDAMQAKELGFIQNKQVDCEKISVQGLNTEELEARLLSHHRLLKGQSSIKTSSLGSQSDRFVSPNCEPGSTHRPAGYSIDEDPIALEFLSSLNQQPSKVILDICNNLEVQETEDATGSSVQQTSTLIIEKYDTEPGLTSDEQLDEYGEQENRPMMIVEEDDENEVTCQMHEIGGKSSTGGWFVSEGESVLLVHDDGSCSLYDIANSEEKSVYKPPSAISSDIWRDCWIVRAASADGCSGKYVVAASAGNSLESGFCSWDFYTKDVQAFHIEERAPNKRSILAPLQDNIVQRSNTSSTLSTIMTTGNRQWWYKPLGPLVVSTASSQRSIQIFDVRDGERVMKWDLQKPVLMMENSCPLQWRNRGKVVISELDGLTLWDVASLNPHALLNIPSSGIKISALHVSNTDAEVGGGVRQRVTSSEAEGHDGVFCTAESINILDFRQPSGIGLKIPNPGVNAQSIFSRGDSVLLGCNSVRPIGKTQFSSQVQQFSVRQQKLVNTYALPESNAHFQHTSLNQVWGNSDLIMAVCGQGLYVFDALRDDGSPSFSPDPQMPREVMGPNDLFTPSFDYASSQVLLISRDRPAMFSLLSETSLLNQRKT